MENTFDKNKHKGILNFLHVVIRIIVIILFIVLGVMAVGFAVVLFIPRGLMDVDMSNIGSWHTRLTNIMVEIDPDFFTGTVNVKRSILAMLLMGIVNVGFVQFIMIYVKKLLGNVKDAKIFDTGNAVILKVLGYGFLTASIILPIFTSMAMLTVANMLDIFQDVGYNFSIQWSHVFMGGLILILAYVFSYGSYLQEEHDLTV